MPHHRVILEGLHAAPVGTRLCVEGEEAHHAIRVKRLEAGDVVEVLNGRGLRVSGKIAATHKLGKHGWQMEIDATRSETEPRDERLEVFAAAAKGERLEEMVESLSQIGVSLFRPLLTERTVVDPREGKLARLSRIALESIKQCGRSWPIQIGEAITLREALRSQSGVTICAADASGGSPSLKNTPERVVLLVGPEGGWSPAEFKVLTDAGVTLQNFGPHIMRVETAAVVGAGILSTLLRPGVHSPHQAKS